MNAEQLRQYQQILDFPLDEPDAHCRFRERLARENRWSASHADRVIAEYRRFALLAVASGHPVSPSDSVDQAWHLHLLDTRSYWGKFCPEALNHPLHHLPNRGGAAEREKLVDWYRRTLVSYARLFGEAPPQDIWPPAEQRFATASHFVRIDTRSHWLIAKPDCPQWLPRLSCTAGFCLGLGLFLLLPVGCALSPDDWEPIDPARYRWFISLMALAIALWLLVRRKATGTQSPSVREIKPDDLDPYEWAYLVDGPKRVLQAALLRLIHLDCVELDAQTKVLDALPAADPDHGLHPIERRIFLAIGNGCTVSGLHRAEAPPDQADQSSSARSGTPEQPQLPESLPPPSGLAGVAGRRGRHVLDRSCVQRKRGNVHFAFRGGPDDGAVFMGLSVKATLSKRQRNALGPIATTLAGDGRAARRRPLAELRAIWRHSAERQRPAAHV
jgi:hypothetical protein